MELPFRCGRYELVEHLGGGMADVYRAHDTVIGRTVAVKVLREENCADQDTRARFLREAKIAGSIVHDNIVHMYDFGEVEGRPYIVMEFLWGEDLRAAIEKKKVGDVRYRIHIALGIARAFEHIHSIGIVHRDLKPENISVDAVGKVKLVDFGIAKSKDLSLTKAGFTLGTPMYMAPEQVRGDEVTPLVDVYAYGVVLYELFTGVRPISGGNVGEVFEKILKQPIEFGPLEECGVGRRVVTLVEQLLRKNPEERPQSFTRIREELESIHADMEAGRYDFGRGKPPIKAVPLPSAKAAGKPLPSWVKPAAAGAAAFLAVVLLLAVLLRPSGESEGQIASGGEAPDGMVLIPAGSFRVGEGGQAELLEYYIDRTEVSNREYARYATDAGARVPAGMPDQPVTGITIDDARAYAKWAGKRLPTSEEWEKAARGSDGFLYPWGNQHNPSKANVADNAALSAHGLMPVDSMPEGASPFGVLHLAGNVRELVQEFATPGPDLVSRYALLLAPPPTAEETWCVVRGGAYNQPLLKNAAYSAELIPARFAAQTIGFRCVKDAR